MFSHMSTEPECDICSRKADKTFKRVEVWSDETWRLTMSLYSSVKGFCYLEPKRHIRYITELDGREAKEFGMVMSHTSRAIKRAIGAKLVYVYIYGDHIPHLHVHLAPHVEGDIFYDDVIKKDVAFSQELMTSPVVDELSAAIRDNLS